jgi:type IV pilus biogenesis protein CpaD/CtpE
MCPRATDMLAVAVQLPAAVVTDACCGVTERAPSWGEPEPEASAGAASASNAQVADPTDLMRTTKPPVLAW